MDEQKPNVKLPKEAHQFAIALGLGLGTNGWGFLAAWLGFKAWDKYIGPDLQRNREKLQKLMADADLPKLPNGPVGVTLTPQQQKTSAWVILGGVAAFAVLVIVMAALSGG
jgi:hypothetical protein